MAQAADRQDDCLFCRIVDGRVSAAVVHRSDHVVGFKDIHPQAPVHVLFVPRRHIESAGTLSEADQAVLYQLIAAARRVAGELGVAERGYRLVFNVGAEAGLTVPHLHLHLLGGRPMKWPPG